MAKTLLTTKEAADYLSVSVSFLAKDRMKKNKGEIPYVPIGKKTIRYVQEELDKYLENKKRNSR